MTRNKPEYTRYDFAQKTDSEGGVGEMIGYLGDSLDRYDLPPSFKEQWCELVDLYETVSEQIWDWFDENLENEENV